jgi:quinoprotein glucose dehydrogenase
MSPISRLVPVMVSFGLWACCPTAEAANAAELARNFKQLPTVAEKDLPALPNERGTFPGSIKHPGLVGHVWVKFPFVENPGSFGFDRKGRLFVAEANRFWLGVPDLRGANEMIRGDFQAVTVADRQKLYDTFAANFPKGWFTAVADRLIRLEDRDGNGAADHRTLFSDHFHESLDGLGFSVLAEDDAVYFTCIPKVWKLTDKNDDGVADTHDAIVEGFGVRVSFIGHDLHGIIRGPDGRLYFSVGDRGYHVTTKGGRVFPGSGRGAIFRCESDGSGFEVFCKGLRNPQELAFDELGNLFTFDNTGDIGDKARFVYALEGSDTGWDMSHQSAHHYKNALDWGDFHPPVSMWVAEKMFETWKPEQPQWVYPPASHVANGPSGVTWMTGESLPEDLRGKFLLANYSGASANCSALTVGYAPKGAGYVADGVKPLVQGVGVTDVELGYDGNLYICDFGGGWSVNNNGAIHCLTPTDPGQQSAGAKTKQIFAAGTEDKSVADLRTLLDSPDKRIRQMAQFALVKKGADGQAALAALAQAKDQPVTRRLHGIWGLEQIARRGKESTALATLRALFNDGEAEIRANVARSFGSIRDTGSRDALIAALKDASPRVRSLAAIALGNVANRGDPDALAALFALAAENGKQTDVVLRHACLTGLDELCTAELAAAKAKEASTEVRLLAVLFLRRRASAELVKFLDDADQQVKHEVVRAIYDTAALDSAAGKRLATLPATDLPETLQRRVIAANYRLGTDDSARALVQLAGASGLKPEVRESALIALRMWSANIDTDPVLGHYRPQVVKGRTAKALGTAIGDDLKRFLASSQPPALIALGLQLAKDAGVTLDEATLRAQATNRDLIEDVRVAALNSLVAANGAQVGAVVASLLDDPSPSVQANALRHGFALGAADIDARARKAIANGPLPVARAGITGLAKTAAKSLIPLWNERQQTLREELWLDCFLALQGSDVAEVQQAATTYAVTKPTAIQQLAKLGGDAKRGQDVFRNQGACMQCHTVSGQGGVQGPELTKVGERLKADKLLESVIEPNAVIADNYGSSTVTLTDGKTVMGRVAAKTDQKLTLIDPAGKKLEIATKDIKEATTPISAMPPMGLALPPRDLRDLVAYLATLTKDAPKQTGH